MINVLKMNQTINIKTYNMWSLNYILTDKCQYCYIGRLVPSLKLKPHSQVS